MVMMGDLCGQTRLGSTLGFSPIGCVPQDSRLTSLSLVFFTGRIRQRPQRKVDGQ